MDESQADAIARAILQPDPEVRERLHRKRLAEAQSLRKRRMVAWFVIAGVPVGALVALVTGHHFGSGALWGGLAASALGWLVVGLRRRRAA